MTERTGARRPSSRSGQRTSGRANRSSGRQSGAGRGGTTGGTRQGDAGEGAAPGEGNGAAGGGEASGDVTAGGTGQDGGGAGGGASPSTGVQRATYRGVSWRRNPDGAVGWYNEGQDRWVRWRPTGDAPPPPPRWVSEGLPLPPPRVSRAGWRSPYRLVPIVLVAGVCVIGIVQATRSDSNPVASEQAAAQKLVGRCLAQKGTAEGHPAYGSSPVSCALPVADVKVVKVLAGTPGSPHCPATTTAVRLAYPGVRYPHVECVIAVKRS